MSARRNPHNNANRREPIRQAEKRRQSLRGMRRREEINRENAIAFIQEDPRRLAEFQRRNRA